MCHSVESRSTWACELKLRNKEQKYLVKCHAPRERVSWNFAMRHRIPMRQRSRSTWACELKLLLVFPVVALCTVTLHVSVWVEIFSVHALFSRHPCHAPRERVSWNLDKAFPDENEDVTLHVSVWVEISVFHSFPSKIMSRSTWACELKFHVLPYT